jgi:hypothetical protein
MVEVAAGWLNRPASRIKIHQQLVFSAAGNGRAKINHVSGDPEKPGFTSDLP